MTSECFFCCVAILKNVSFVVRAQLDCNGFALTDHRFELRFIHGITCRSPKPLLGSVTFLEVTVHLCRFTLSVTDRQLLQRPIR